MTDLKSLAYELLHEAQQSLQLEGNLNPTAIVITPAENLIFDIEYESEEERDEIYAEMVDVAMEKSASAIVTVNDIYLEAGGAPVRLEGPGWQGLSQSPSEAIAVTVSGGGFETWTLLAPYHRAENQIIFHPAQEKPDPGGELELLGDWTGRTGAA